jgi:RNA ligase (TIGR02306 family)
VYIEIDSWVPHTLAPFLSKGNYPRVYNEVEGERLRTVKLRGQVSQGLLLPVSVLDFDSFYRSEIRVLRAIRNCVPNVDVSEVLGIQKWEPALEFMSADAQGAFPSQIPKTDQERIQNLSSELAQWKTEDLTWEVTEKLEGSSMTCYLIDGEFGVCSRNLDLKETEGNSFWETARHEDIEAKMRDTGPDAQFAIQGELIGPGIQGNIYKLSRPEFHVFDVYNISACRYLNPNERWHLIRLMGLRHVPVLAPNARLYDTLGITDIPHLLKFAEGQTVLLTSNTEREGIVFKEVNGGMSFKAISNNYLLGEK